MNTGTKWCTTAALALAALLAPRAAQAQAPRSGLVVSSFEQAISRPVERIENFSITVDLSDRTLYLMSGDEVVRSYPVSVGQEGYSTPGGTYRINRMIWNPSWTPPNSKWARGRKPEAPGSPGNPMGRVKIFFREPDYYIHGTGHAASLGRAFSHGCIRLRNIDAVEVARIVMVHGGSDRDQDWYQETIDQSATSRTVTLRTPVRVTIRA